MKNDIADIAQLFPKLFTAEKWLPHKPLKIGIHADLIAAGALPPREIRAALRAYASRRMYLAAVAAGGGRCDLDGNPAGEVSPAEAAWAQESLARLDAETAEKAKATKKPATAPAMTTAPTREPQAEAASVIRGHSLADLRAAAARRAAAAQQHAAARAALAESEMTSGAHAALIAMGDGE